VVRFPQTRCNRRKCTAKHMRIGLVPLGPCDVLLETSFKREGAQLESYRAFAGGGVFRLYVVLEDMIADLVQLPS